MTTVIGSFVNKSSELAYNVKLSQPNLGYRLPFRLYANVCISYTFCIEWFIAWNISFACPPLDCDDTTAWFIWENWRTNLILYVYHKHGWCQRQCCANEAQDPLYDINPAKRLAAVAEELHCVDLVCFVRCESEFLAKIKFQFALTLVSLNIQSFACFPIRFIHTELTYFT